MLPDALLRTAIAIRNTLAGRWARLRAEHGEGVVSTAIAVLVMAFLGAVMWLGFKEIWLDAQAATSDQVGEIGR